MLLKYVTRYSRKSLRVLGSVGEPINPSAWRCVDLLPTVNNLCRHNYKRSYVCFTSFQMVLQYCWGFPVPHIRYLVANWNRRFHGMIFTVYTSCEIWYFLSGTTKQLWLSMFYELLCLLSLDHPFAWRLASETRFCNLSFLWCSGKPNISMISKKIYDPFIVKFWTAVCYFTASHCWWERARDWRGMQWISLHKKIMAWGFPDSVWRSWEIRDHILQTIFWVLFHWWWLQQVSYHSFYPNYMGLKRTKLVQLIAFSFQRQRWLPLADWKSRWCHQCQVSYLFGFCRHLVEF